ncbi:MAG: tyrosine-type recombinase/integrase [Chloroflexi bacterium]|nr:tyrosine-type recombinase/integrase [Chloroflexota bacterium]
MGVIERALEIHYSTFPRALPVMRWHDLRASTITVLLDQGVDLLTIQRIVGHRDLATTRRYVGKTPTAMAAAADKLGEAMGR